MLTTLIKLERLYLSPIKVFPQKRLKLEMVRLVCLKWLLYIANLKENVTGPTLNVLITLLRTKRKQRKCLFRKYNWKK